MGEGVACTTGTADVTRPNWDQQFNRCSTARPVRATPAVIIPPSRLCARRGVRNLPGCWFYGVADIDASRCSDHDEESEYYGEVDVSDPSCIEDAPEGHGKGQSEYGER